MTSKIITTTKPLTFRQALAILADINVSYGIFNTHDFVALVKTPYKQAMPSPEEICELIAQRNAKSLANDIKRSERQDRKGERLKRTKMKAWSTIQRRELLIGQRRYLKAKLTIRMQYQRFYQEIQETNLVYPRETRGPEQNYDRIAITAAIALKMLHDIEWTKLPARLRGERIDLRLPTKRKQGIEPVPSHQTFFTLFKTLDIKEIKNLLLMTDDKSQAQLESWKGEAIPLIYAADGSGHPLQGEEPCVYKGKPTYRRKSTHLVLLQNLNSRTVRGLFYPTLTGQSRRDIREFIRALPPGATLLGDREFDVEYLQKEAQKTNIDLQARPRLKNGQPARTPHRRTAHKKFNKRLYRLRKLNESIFAILVNRGILVPRRTTIALSAKAALWACVGHNLDCLINVELNKKIFKWVYLPIQKELPAISSLATKQVLAASQENISLSSGNSENIPAVTIIKTSIKPIVTTIEELNVTIPDQKTLPSQSKKLATTRVESNPISSSSTQLKEHITVPRTIFSDHVVWLILSYLIQCYPQAQNRTRIYQAIGLPRSYCV